MIPNPFKVPKSQWKRWSPSSQAMFNQLYDKMINCPLLFQHPQINITGQPWRTIAWNAAWTAADLLRGFDATVGRR